MKVDVVDLPDGTAIIYNGDDTNDPTALMDDFNCDVCGWTWPMYARYDAPVSSDCMWVGRCCAESVGARRWSERIAE